MPLSFTAIDFETACGARSSVCAVGMARVRDGAVVETYERLVCPPQGPWSFTNTWVHGIGPDDVLDAPTWDRLLPEVLGFIGGDVLVAHNAPFDRSVLVRASQECGCPDPGLDFVCTLKIARAVLRLDSYTLPRVTAELGLPTFDHHEAGADARAAASIAVALAARAGVDDLRALAAVRAVA
ncbi:MAG TPA: exonuclease domain-containing protein [Cellulomonas sp.]